MDCPPEGACRYGFFTLRQNSPCSPGCVLRDPVESRALCTRYGVLTYLGRSDTQPSFVLSLFSFPQGSSKLDTGMSARSRPSRTFLAHVRGFPRSVCPSPRSQRRVRMSREGVGPQRQSETVHSAPRPPPGFGSGASV